MSDRYRIEHGDCLDLLKREPANSWDGMVTDPPYLLVGDSGSGFMGREWDSLSIASVTAGAFFRCSSLVSSMGAVSAAAAPANTENQSLPTTQPAQLVANRSAAHKRTSKRATVTNSAAGSVITRDEALALCSELFPGLIDCLLRLPTDARFALPTSLPGIEALNTAHELASLLRRAPEWLVLETGPTSTGSAISTSGATAGHSGTRRAKRSTNATSGAVAVAESIAAPERSSATTWSRIESRKIIEKITSLPCVRAATRQFTSAPGIMGTISVWWHERWAREVLRVLKPGAFIAVCGGTRTYHHVTIALELAGWQVRDSVQWCYGSGFPKSHNLPGGLGTALKPSHEPVILARKPLEGTVAQNYEKWGTGVLNIDACRVAHASASDRAAHDAQVQAIKARGGSMENSWKNSSDLSGANDVSDAGRWPPNLLLTHDARCQRVGTRSVKANPTWDTPNRETAPSAFTGSDVSVVKHGVDVEDVPAWECVEGCPVLLLDQQSGEVSSGGRSGDVRGHGMRGNERNGVTNNPLPPSGGTASRFFPQFEWNADLDDLGPFIYAAKSSRAERDKGLEHFKGNAAQRDTPNPGGIDAGSKNVHPTVKSVELIRYFTRLITPRVEGRRPKVGSIFLGSGTDGVAALLEGCDFVGFELNDTEEEPFVSIARARCEHALGYTYVPRESLRAADPPKQRGLFEARETA